MSLIDKELATDLQPTCDQIVINSNGEPVDVSDNISRQATIANVKSIASVLAKSDKQKALCERILFMLETMPTAYPVIQELQKEVDYWHELSNSYEETIIKLTEAISAHPEREKGRWIPVSCERRLGESGILIKEYVEAPDPYDVVAVKCSKCGTVFDFDDARFYCSQCGADMREGEDDG